jgi:6-phosphogluconolactonase
MIKHIDDRRAAFILKEEILIPYLVDLFYIELEKTLATASRFNVALAGGSTPKKLYQAIASDVRAISTRWDKVYVYYGDERAVPLNDKESNYHMSLEAGFKKLPSIHIVPMQAYLKTQEACKDYESKLPAHLDLIFLGMGDDGHTASLFPNDPLCEIKDRKVALGFVKAKDSTRMTLTFPYINKSSKIVMLIVGAAKKEKIKEVLSPQGTSNPSYYIGTLEHKAYFILDEAAGALL